MKIFVLYSILFLCALGIIFLFFHQFSLEILTERHIDNMRELTDRISAQVENLVFSLDKIALQAATNPVISKYFSHDISWELLSVEEKTELQKMLVSITVSGSAPSLRVSLYNKDGKYTSFGIPDSPSVTNTKALVAGRYAYTLEKMDGTSYRRLELADTDFWGNNPARQLCTLVRPILDSAYSCKIGFAEIQTDFNEVAQLLESHLKKGITVSLLPEAPPFLLWENASSGYTYTTDRKNRNIEFYRKSEDFGFFIVVSESMDSFLEPVHRISLLFFSATFLLVALLCAVIYVTSKKLVKPLDSVLLLSQRFALETPVQEKADTDETPPAVKNQDEFDTISSTFEKLFETLQRSICEKNSAKTEELKAHFIALQSQIDPHFLYNMLAIISAAGREKKVPEVTEICKNLTQMLRYISVFNEHIVTLADELAHIQSYLHLMKIRFEDQFSYKIRYAENFDATLVKLPRLTLQPIVENCFQHAFKRTEPPWNIEIILSLKQNKWSVSVEDNGCGIDEKKQYEIFFIISEFLIDPAQHIDEVRFGGMGLVNCGVRLKMFSLCDSVFSIEKSGLGGSKITIGGDINDSGGDC